MVPGESDHKYAIQEAHKHYMLRMDNHNWVLQQDQRIAPADITRCKPLAIRHGDRISIKARLWLKSLVSMSLHISNIYAKLPVAGPKGATSHR